jgi:hypothetical protein
MFFSANFFKISRAAGLSLLLWHRNTSQISALESCPFTQKQFYRETCVEDKPTSPMNESNCSGNRPRWPGKSDDSCSCYRCWPLGVLLSGWGSINSRLYSSGWGSRTSRAGRRCTSSSGTNSIRMPQPAYVVSSFPNFSRLSSCSSISTTN